MIEFTEIIVGSIDDAMKHLKRLSRRGKFTATLKAPRRATRWIKSTRRRESLMNVFMAIVLS
jgi:hypothetical protein